MHTAVIGVNHKVAEIPMREMIAKAFLKRFSHNTVLAEGSHFVVLSTCNRAEIYFSSLDLATTHEEVLSILREEVSDDFEQKCYSFFGKDSLRHLARVTAGLDSAIIAETEIQGQVKQAYELAALERQLPTDLHFLFQKALKIGKEIRTKFLFRQEIQGIEQAVLAKVKDSFQKIKPPMLFIGASKINVKIARYLLLKGFSRIAFTNRSDRPLAPLKTAFHTMSWQQFYKDWGHYDCIVAATKSPYYLIDKTLYAQAPRKRLLIDLAVPRNIDPAIDADIVNIDFLQDFLVEHQANMQAQAARAERRIQTASDLLVERKNIHV